MKMWKIYEKMWKIQQSYYFRKKKLKKLDKYSLYKL